MITKLLGPSRENLPDEGSGLPLVLEKVVLSWLTARWSNKLDLYVPSIYFLIPALTSQ